MARRPKNPQALDDELGKVVEAARLFFHQRKTQAEIARKMRVSQSTVSRWLGRAERERLVTVLIQPPEVERIQARLRERLPSSFRAIKVVPSGLDKNVENIGDATARLLIEAILDVQRSKLEANPGSRPDVSVAFSSGETLRRAADGLVAWLRDDLSLQEQLVADLTFLPAAIFWDTEIKAYYPVTLVTTLWTQLSPILKDRVHAFAPVLPKSYYDASLWRPENAAARERALADSGATEVLERARKADIFVLGMGTLGDATYPLVLDALKVENPERVWKGAEGDTEFIYVPLKDTYDIGARVVRVGLDDLSAAALGTGSAHPRWCIGAGGGISKARAVAELLAADPPILNCIVTDSTSAEMFLNR